MSNELQVTVNQNYEVLQTPDGKFVRKAIYQPFSSVRPETREQKIAMMNLLESDEIALPMNFHIGASVEIADIIHNPYDSLDEDTGELTYGVLTYLLTPEGVAYVTSSKSVYYTTKKIMSIFGEPHYGDEETVKVEIIKKKGHQHQFIDIKVVG